MRWLTLLTLAALASAAAKSQASDYYKPLSYYRPATSNHAVPIPFNLNPTPSTVVPQGPQTPFRFYPPAMSNYYVPIPSDYYPARSTVTPYMVPQGPQTPLISAYSSPPPGAPAPTMRYYYVPSTNPLSPGGYYAPSYR